MTCVECGAPALGYRCEACTERWCDELMSRAPKSTDVAACVVCRASDRRLAHGICQACGCTHIIADMPVPIRIELTVERLARALFEADPDVQSYVHRVSDAYMDRPLEDGRRMSSYDPARVRRALDRAWERDEPDHARTRWTARAQAVLERLRGLK